MTRINTLEDVYLRLPALYSTASATVYETAFRKFARLSGRRLSHTASRRSKTW